MDGIDVIFDHCVFNTNGYGILFNAGNQDCVVKNCSFPDSILQNIIAIQVYGLVLNNNSFTNSGEFNTMSVVQLGGSNTDEVVQDAVVSNCTFANLSTTNMAMEGLAVAQGSSVRIDSCVFNMNNTSQAVSTNLSAIHIGTPTSLVTGFVIENNVIQGPAINGLHVDHGSSNGVIENNLVSGNLNDGILLDNASSITVENNNVADNLFQGITLTNGSTFNTIVNNTVNNNGNAGIYISAAQGTFAASTSNTIQGNSVTNNGTAANPMTFGIYNASKSATNQIISNSASNNGNNPGFTQSGLLNYGPMPFYPQGSIVVSAAGSPTLAGANIQPGPIVVPDPSSSTTGAIRRLPLPSTSHLKTARKTSAKRHHKPFFVPVPDRKKATH